VRLDIFVLEALETHVLLVNIQMQVPLHAPNALLGNILAQWQPPAQRPVLLDTNVGQVLPPYALKVSMQS
jgi:hypothetical protein